MRLLIHASAAHITVLRDSKVILRCAEVEATSHAFPIKFRDVRNCRVEACHFERWSYFRRTSPSAASTHWKPLVYRTRATSHSLNRHRYHGPQPDWRRRQLFIASFLLDERARHFSKMAVQSARIHQLAADSREIVFVRNHRESIISVADVRPDEPSPPADEISWPRAPREHLWFPCNCCAGADLSFAARPVEGCGHHSPACVDRARSNPGTINRF